MLRNWTALEISALIGIGGSVVAIAVPAFLDNLSASKLSEPIDGLHHIVTHAVTYSEDRPTGLAFPPSAPLTPERVPRGARAEPNPEDWEHLTWRSLDFRIEQPHYFAYRFDSAFDPGRDLMRFVATAHGDLDGDGTLSTFQVRGERVGDQRAVVLPGMYVHREVE